MTATRDEYEILQVYLDIIKPPTNDPVLSSSRDGMLIVPNYLNRPAKKVFYDEFVMGRKIREVKTHYLFQLDATCEGLAPIFSLNDKTKNLYTAHFNRFNNLIDMPEASFHPVKAKSLISSFLGDKVGVVIQKNPHTGMDLYARLVEGLELYYLRQMLTKTINKSHTLQGSQSTDLLVEAKKYTFLQQRKEQLAKVLREQGMLDLEDDELNNIFNEMAKYKIYENGVEEPFTYERHYTLRESVKGYHVFIDQREDEILVKGKPLSIQTNTYSYKLLILFAENVGQTISYEELSKMFWGKRFKDTNTVRKILVQRGYLNKVTNGIVGKYVKPDGDKFIIDKELKTCIIKLVELPLD